MENQEIKNVETVSVGDWLITILITAIPLVNIIMLFVWAFGGGNNPSKSNWAKATLLWIAIMIALTILVIVIFGAAMLGFMESGPDFIDSSQY